MEIINKLTFHPKNQLKLYQECTLSKISSHVTVIEISKSGLKTTLIKLSHDTLGYTGKWYTKHRYPV